MFAAPCCPRCGARYGWALVDGALLAGLLAWLQADRVLTVERTVRRAAVDIERSAMRGRRAFGPLTVTVQPSALGPPPAWVSDAARQAAEAGMSPMMVEAARAHRLGLGRPL